jgi:hypothetical protein
MSDYASAGAAAEFSILRKTSKKRPAPAVPRLASILIDGRAVPMVFRCNVRSVLTTRVAKCLAAIVIVVGILPFAASYSRADAAELAVERVLHMDGNQNAGAVQILADFGVATLAAVCLGLQLPLDAPMVSGGLDRRMSRVRVLRI